MRNIIALDIGGTSSKYGVINADGQILDRSQTVTAKGLPGIITSIRHKLKEYEAYHIEGIAISVPGAVNEMGVVYGASAIPFVHGVNVKEYIEREINLPVTIENDANCAAISEIWRGNAKGKKDVILVILGTGVGGAIIKDGMIHRGANLFGGEFGFMILNPEDIGNKQNTFSEIASTSSIIRRVAENKGVEMATLTGEEIFTAAEAGDKDCMEAIDEFYKMLAIGIYNLQYMYDPEVILIGGGISVREDLLGRLEKEIAQIVKGIEISVITPVVDYCHFRADANLIGAAYHYYQSVTSE